MPHMNALMSGVTYLGMNRRQDMHTHGQHYVTGEFSEDISSEPAQGSFLRGDGLSWPDGGWLRGKRGRILEALNRRTEEELCWIQPRTHLVQLSVSQRPTRCFRE